MTLLLLKLLPDQEPEDLYSCTAVQSVSAWTVSAPVCISEMCLTTAPSTSDWKKQDIKSEKRTVPKDCLFQHLCICSWFYWTHYHIFLALPCWVHVPLSKYDCGKTDLSDFMLWSITEGFLELKAFLAPKHRKKESTGAKGQGTAWLHDPIGQLASLDTHTLFNKHRGLLEINTLQLEFNFTRVYTAHKVAYNT